MCVELILCGSLTVTATQVSDTEEGIDFEALKVREPILFSDTVNLFGDDFGDNGEAHLSVRVVC